MNIFKFFCKTLSLRNNPLFSEKIVLKLQNSPTKCYQRTCKKFCTKSRNYRTSISIYFSFLQNKNYGFESLIVVSGSPSTIRHSNFSQLGLPMPEWWQIVESLLNFSFVIFKRKYGFKKVIVPGFHPNIRHSIFNKLGLPALEFWWTIGWRLIEGSLKCRLKIPNLSKFFAKHYRNLYQNCTFFFEKLWTLVTKFCYEAPYKIYRSDKKRTRIPA